MYTAYTICTSYTRGCSYIAIAYINIVVCSNLKIPTQYSTNSDSFFGFRSLATDLHFNAPAMRSLQGKVNPVTSDVRGRRMTVEELGLGTVSPRVRYMFHICVVLVYVLVYY